MSEPTAERHRPLLGRLNRRGFRLVMLLDALAVLLLTVVTMVWRFGDLPWPTYTTGAYAFSFAVSTMIFVLVFYFGGLYEREPRLGGDRVLARAARLSLAAGSGVALLNLALTFMIPNISIGGHLGGLVGGILATFALAHFRYARPRSLGPAIVGLIMVASLVLAYVRVESYVLPVG